MKQVTKTQWFSLLLVFLIFRPDPAMAYMGDFSGLVVMGYVLVAGLLTPFLVITARSLFRTSGAPRFAIFGGLAVFGVHGLVALLMGRDIFFHIPYVIEALWDIRLASKFGVLAGCTASFNVIAMTLLLLGVVFGIRRCIGARKAAEE